MHVMYNRMVIHSSSLLQRPHGVQIPIDLPADTDCQRPIATRNFQTKDLCGFHQLNQKNKRFYCFFFFLHISVNLISLSGQESACIFHGTLHVYEVQRNKKPLLESKQTCKSVSKTTTIIKKSLFKIKFLIIITITSLAYVLVTFAFPILREFVFLFDFIVRF